MSAITTHVLDVALGKPAAKISATLEFSADLANWQPAGAGVTNEDGRIKELLAEHFLLAVGYYRLTFQTGEYFHRRQTPGFYPIVTVVFEIKDPKQHYHVPILLSPYGYSTYRGS
ncbi:MAG: hydroxyisourate hydrolase [Bacteriovoracia bacterium]